MRKRASAQSSLFLEETFESDGSDWLPTEPPSLDGIDSIDLDFETEGLRWWDKHRPIGAAIGLPDGRTYYLPWGHLPGGNLSEDAVKTWFHREVRGKHVRNLSTRFDIHMARVWGVDLVKQGCTFEDVGHHAALLDDHRKEFSLESIAQDFVGEGKVTGLDKSRMKHYHAGKVQAYAKQDVRLVRLVAEKTMPRIEVEGLKEVLALECMVIPVVVEMEKNGAPIDRTLLKDLLKWCEQEYLKCLWEIYRETGIKFNPKSNIDMGLILEKRGIEIKDWTPSGKIQVNDLILKKIDDPVVQHGNRARKLASLKNKFYALYEEETRDTGILRYALHQLKTDYSSDDMGKGGGTVTGRFSSSSYGSKVAPDGVNIQQVMTKEKQAKSKLEHGVRELFTPPAGRKWLSADAMQIQYRFFAHYAGNKMILDKYAEDVRTNFHLIVQNILQQAKPDLPYRRTKDVNFAKIFGAGIRKMAAMMEVSEEEAAKVNDIYNQMIPEVGPLIARAIRAAENRGYVKSILGRRFRFPHKIRIRKALCSIIQGGEADYNKIKLVELYEHREELDLTMRFTVHDEIDCDVPDAQVGVKVEEILNRQSIPNLRVPILWEVKTGDNWKECH